MEKEKTTHITKVPVRYMVSSFFVCNQYTDGENDTNFAYCISQSLSVYILFVKL